MDDNNTLNVLIKRCRSALIPLVVFSLSINLLMLVTPIYMLQIFDRVLASRSIETLIALSIIAVFALIVLALLDAVRGVLLARVGGWMEEAAGPDLVAVNVKNASSLRTKPTIQSLRDLATIRNFLSSSLIVPLLDAPWTPVFIVVIFILHPLLGWFSLAGAAILMVVAFSGERRTRNLFGEAASGSNVQLRQAESAVQNAEVLGAMGMTDAFVNRWRSVGKVPLQKQIQATQHATRHTSISRFIRLVMQVGILGIGAWLVVLGELTAGGMIAGSILMGRALAPVEQAIGGWRSLLAARVAYRNVSKLLFDTPLRKESMPLPAPKGLLEVEAITYLYPSKSDPAIRSVSFILQPGESMGLIGPTASGKTTLARLLVGNFAPRLGHVRLDGIDLAKWDEQDRGQYVGYLPQNVELFSGKVRENIARLKEATPEQVISASKLAGVHDLIMRLPEGYETEIGEGGVYLSGGQRQGIGLARALFGDVRLVVLDEPNSSLDQSGEQELLVALDKLREASITTVVIAHRPSLLQRTDKLLVLTDGAVSRFDDRDKVLQFVTESSVNEKE